MRRNNLIILAWLCFALGTIGINVPMMLHAHSAYVLESTKEDREKEEEEEPLDQEEKEEYKEQKESKEKNNFQFISYFPPSGFILKKAFSLYSSQKHLNFEQSKGYLLRCPLYILFSQLKLDC